MKINTKQQVLAAITAFGKQTAWERLLQQQISPGQRKKKPEEIVVYSTLWIRRAVTPPAKELLSTTEQTRIYKHTLQISSSITPTLKHLTEALFQVIHVQQSQIHHEASTKSTLISKTTWVLAQFRILLPEALSWALQPARFCIWTKATRKVDLPPWSATTGCPV